MSAEGGGPLSVPALRIGALRALSLGLLLFCTALALGGGSSRIWLAILYALVGLGTAPVVLLEGWRAATATPLRRVGAITACAALILVLVPCALAQTVYLYSLAETWDHQRALGKAVDVVPELFSKRDGRTFLFSATVPLVFSFALRLWSQRTWLQALLGFGLTVVVLLICAEARWLKDSGREAELFLGQALVFSAAYPCVAWATQRLARWRWPEEALGLLGEDPQGEEAVEGPGAVGLQDEAVEPGVELP